MTKIFLLVSPITDVSEMAEKETLLFSQFKSRLSQEKIKYFIISGVKHSLSRLLHVLQISEKLNKPCQ